MIEEVLNQRQATYGDFTKNAEVSQMMKYFMAQGTNYKQMPVAHREALEMIVHKIARIVNGDSYFIDSWKDICGYSQLVINELLLTEGATDSVIIKKEISNRGDYIL